PVDLGGPLGDVPAGVHQGRPPVHHPAPDHGDQGERHRHVREPVDPGGLEVEPEQLAVVPAHRPADAPPGSRRHAERLTSGCINGVDDGRTSNREDRCTAVVVTGAGRGLGRAYAVAAAERGASVVVNDVDADEAHEVADAIVAAHGVAVAHPADVADPMAAEAVVARCVAEFGTVDGLVNNAGYGMIDAAAPEDQDPAEL